MSLRSMRAWLSFGVAHGEVGLAAVVAVDERNEQFLVGKDQHGVVEAAFFLFNSVQLLDGIENLIHRFGGSHQENLFRDGSIILMNPVKVF